MNGPKTKLSPSSNLHTFSLSFEVWICYPKEACFLEFIANHNSMCHGLEIDTCKNLPIAPLQMCSFRIGAAGVTTPGFSFSILLIFSRVLRICQNIFVCYLDSGYTQKQSTRFYFYNFHYLNSGIVKMET
jgi:hypothetical protein